MADIIQLSRLDEQQDSTVSMESVELDELAQDVVNNLRSHAEKKEILLDYHGEPATIQGVRHVLYEMLYNIADNAVRYTNPGGHIHIYVGKRGGKPFYRVEDDGIGIPKSEQKRIFERFYRVDKSHSRQTGGTGLDCPLSSMELIYTMRRLQWIVILEKVQKWSCCFRQLHFV